MRAIIHVDSTHGARSWGFLRAQFETGLGYDVDDNALALLINDYTSLTDTSRRDMFDEIRDAGWVVRDVELIDA